MFEASVASADSAASDVGLLGLLRTSYGRYALAHLVGGGLQLGGGSWIRTLGEPPLLHGLPALGAVSLGLEAWGWALKGSLTVLSVPGMVAAGLVGFVYVGALRKGAA
jgi:hypothetical protein